MLLSHGGVPCVQRFLALLRGLIIERRLPALAHIPKGDEETTEVENGRVQVSCHHRREVQCNQFQSN